MLSKGHPLRYFVVFTIILAVPAFLWNLGLLPFIEDEALRALIALEMDWQNDFITPTTGGELYFKKPPLYNWIVWVFFQIFGSTSEFVMRLPMVLATFGFTITIYHFVRKESSQQIALLTALSFLTCGRIITYETLHGLIDILFSWIIYAMLMQIYFRWKANQKFLTFFIPYVLATIAYFLKGLPALVFLGFSLLAFFIVKKQFKRLFHWHHIVSFLFLALWLTLYYGTYMSRNDIPLTDVFTVLWTESSRRTIIQFGWIDTVKHLFTFPFEFIYHFLPWTLLIPLMFVKSAWQKLKFKPFIRFNLLMLIVNIPIYWTSPQVYARYLLVFVPLLTYVLFELYSLLKQNNHRIVHFIEKAFLSIMTIMIALPIAIFFQPDLKGHIPATITGILGILAVGIITYKYWKDVPHRLFYLAILMLVVRLIIDGTVLVDRYIGREEVAEKIKIMNLAQQVAPNETIHYYYPNSYPPDHYYGKWCYNYRTMFYFSSARQEILTPTTNLETGKTYLVWDEIWNSMNKSNFALLDSISFDYTKRYSYLVKKQQ